MENEWPWLANLIHVPTGMFFCGGTLIMPKRVLTAAHCIQLKHSAKRLNPEEIEVQLGRFNLNANESRSKSFKPIKVIVHPDWNPADDRYDADLALLIAENKMETGFISPICLRSQSDTNSDDNVEGTVVGWGFSKNSQTDHEKIPRKAQVRKVSAEKCLLEDTKIAEISSERTFCITGVNGEAGPCKGDSGGGFFVETEGVWFIRGIVSAGILTGNCPDTKHSVMTKIDAFNEWIKQNVTYEVSFTYKMKQDRSGDSYHILSIPEVLRRGAILSPDGRFADWSVERARLNDQKMTYFPGNIGNLFPNLGSLYARNSQIKFIDRRNFQNLSRLTNLFLENNLIEEIPFDTFYGLVSLRGIFLSSNKLKVIHPETFVNNPTLVTVFLGNNQIQSLESRGFVNKNVNSLLLDQNLLESIASDAFGGLANLKTLDVSGNKLKSLHIETFSNNSRLQVFKATNNQIVTLDKSLFKNNQDLNELSFENNQIAEIKCQFINPGTYNFKNNICIDDFFFSTTSSQLNEMNADFQRVC